VITIYFCGTGITSEWSEKETAHNWNNTSGFWTPELVSSLYKVQLTDQGYQPGYQHYKHIVNGVGTGVNLPLADVLAQGFSSNPINPRGWAVCLREGKDYLEQVALANDRDIILNVIGHSRGGVLAIWLAHEAQSIARVKAINIIAYDPVPGDKISPSPEIFVLGEKVKNYIGFYAEDERTMLFEPMIPIAETDKTNVWLIRVPGSHETLVGNYQRDGHSTDFHATDWWELTETWLKDELWPASRLTAAVTQELLGSKNWGGVRYSWQYRQGGIDQRQSNLLLWADQMRSAEAQKYYEYMRTVSFLPFVLPWTTITIFDNGKTRILNGFEVGAKAANGPRSATLIQDRNSFIYVGLQNQVPAQTGPEMWAKLVELGVRE
jgi:hypothetical protein